MNNRQLHFYLLLLLLAAPLLGAENQPEPAWSHVGLLRVRDLTPFGILRLDFLPAHAVTGKPGTWALEANLSYQNTFVLSENVADYLPLDRKGRSLLQATLTAPSRIMRAPQYARQRRSRELWLGVAGGSPSGLSTRWIVPSAPRCSW